MTATEFLDAMMTSLAVWREARGETYQTMLGVAYVIKNRADHPRWWGNTPTSVVLKPYQFASFNKNDANSLKFPMVGKVWEDCFHAAQAALTKSEPDPTNGATHFYDVSIINNPPSWARELTFMSRLGGLLFFKETT